MPYCQLFYHLVWATKRRQPLLTAEVEPEIHGYLRSKAIGLEAVVYALNGVADHVHLVVSIPPKVAVATFVGQVKAVASTHFNVAHRARGVKFAWQEEYGAFSFDAKRLPNLIAYVERQKQHHAHHSTIPILERTEGETVTTVREFDETYAVEAEHWRAEMLSLSG
jgi:putative transposase